MAQAVLGGPCRAGRCLEEEDLLLDVRGQEDEVHEHPSVRKRRFDPAVLYASKQGPIGWSDRQTLMGSDGGPIPIEIAGATERVIEMVLRYQRTRLEQAGTNA